MKKILLFSPFFFPEPISTGKYNTHLAEALVGLKHHLEVIASYPLYPDWQPIKADTQLKGVKIHRGGLLPYSKQIELRRLQLELGFAYHSIVNFFKIKNVDLIISVFPPMLFSLILSLVIPKKCTHIGLVHDVQGIMASVSNSPLKGVLIKLIRFFEKMAFKKCDRLIFISGAMANKSLELYKLDKQKVRISYPFVSIDKSNPTMDLVNLFSDDKKHIVYSGAIGKKQNPFGLLNLFKVYTKKNPDVVCHIFSRGPLFDELKDLSNGGNDSIKFHDLVSQENLYELYLKSNVQIIPQKSGTADGAIPSKLPNIIASGTPVFSIGDPNSDLANLIQQSGIGYSAVSWEVNQVATELDSFLNESLKYSHLQRQEKVKDFVENTFGMEQLIQQLIDE